MCSVKVGKKLAVQERNAHTRNQWNETEKVMRNSGESTVSCKLTLSGHFLRGASI
jgi:hypothetical protein